MLIITVSLPLYSKVLWEKVPHVIPIRMTHGDYTKKAFQKGNSKPWTQSTHERGISLIHKDWVGYATQHIVPRQWKQGQERIPLLNYTAHPFHCCSWRQDIFSALHFTFYTFNVSAFCPCYLFYFFYCQFSLVSYFIHYFTTKSLSSQSYGFSSSHVWMWELDHKEGWEVKNWCFRTVVLEKTLESPLDCKEIKPVNPKGNQFWIFTGRIDVEVEAPVF